MPRLGIARTMWMSQVILLLILLWVSFAVRCDAANPPDCITTLSKASLVSWDIPADTANPSPVFGAYKQACKLKIDPRGKELDWLIKEGTPAGRVYACFIAWELDFSAGLARFESLKEDSAPVNYKSGCFGFPTTVNSIASQFLANRKYHDFPTSVFCEKPIKQ